MTTLIVAGLFVAGLVAASIEIAIENRNPPEGYEDANGFHFGREPDAKGGAS